MAVLTQERLKELLHYDPETGVFRWLVDIRNGEHRARILVKAGDIAGYRGGGRNSRTEYVSIRIERRLYGAHRLAWLYVKGEWPPLIDHRDLDGTNNRFLNLRLSDKSSNAANTSPPRNNTSGVKGVYFDRNRNRWVAEIWHQNKKYRMGRHRSLEGAAARELFGEFARAA